MSLTQIYQEIDGDLRELELLSVSGFLTESTGDSSAMEFIGSLRKATSALPFYHRLDSAANSTPTALATIITGLASVKYVPAIFKFVPKSASMLPGSLGGVLLSVVVSAGAMKLVFSTIQRIVRFCVELTVRKKLNILYHVKLDELLHAKETLTGLTMSDNSYIAATAKDILENIMELEYRSGDFFNK